MTVFLGAQMIHLLTEAITVSLIIYLGVTP